MIEPALAAGIFVFMSASLLMFGEYFFGRQKALSLARFGTALQSCGLLSDEDIDEEIRIFADQLESSGRLRLAVHTGRFSALPGSSLYKLMGTRVTMEVPGFFGIDEISVEQQAEVGI